uniref:Argininosuccinate synthase n=1 Tax=Timspurckia oligopyrenoides TaxID=708627 RepID=A0A7S1EQF7_9RHOD|mmetsp:Transcript_12792/g.23002  ORF Transcript_12792/g.23002 Transcript_12792/m.23002 type:complete len:428 (+) Transcript_12792:106-1389(+)|eukprot:CAMPEP_0182441278 /NCGR_PEP_ID=MMETSP1172-20130603/215_1 /TAXON_ID=708627 /ORGANISM="Timspurckia oligopyrenoides, Strain CCMP3278" /LENGTH=427 /DNA_ID=CAMNT_0024635459 /DNA_START=42 /DNA_END=1325 /DNA_ORIENTATION=+
MSKGKVVLAYSGGLDTSIILKWLQDEGFEVICYIANVGQDDNFEAAKEKAMLLGASKVYVEDLREDFVVNYIFPAIKANAIYESRYLLGTSLARPCIAKRQIEIANAEGAEFVAHGATGKGNDQVRFELTFYALHPKIRVIAPWRDATFLSQFKGRTDLLNFAKAKGIPMPAGDKPPYSMDDNLMHISFESGNLEDPASPPEESMYRKTLPMSEWDNEAEIVRIEFHDGAPVKVTSPKSGTSDQPLDLYLLLNEVARRHGIGRIDIVENRFVGIKSRGVYETPGATILRCAHLDIEGIAMDREVMRLRDMLSPKFAELVYNGFWFAPEMDFLLAAMHKAQELIDGWVDVLCYKGSCMAVARSSPSALYNENIASMESVEGYDPVDAGGFININAIRLRAHREIVQKTPKERLASISVFKGVTYDIEK